MTSSFGTYRADVSGMISALTTTKGLTTEAIKSLADHTGPCVTITIPNRHPGAQQGSRLAIFRNQLKTAEGMLASSRLNAQARSLLEPLEEMAQDLTLEQGGVGWTVFRATDLVACYRTHSPIESLSVASHFRLSPFITSVSMPGDLFVLGLSTKRLRFLEYSNGECHDVELPDAVPRSLEAAGHFDRSERSLENRSSAGVTEGNLTRVRFGTTTDRDRPDAYLHDFFELVDRELIPFMKGRPLVLMGVPREIAAFRRAAGGRNTLIDGHPGNIDFLTPAEIGSRAQHTRLAEYFKRGSATLAEIRELRDRSRVAIDVPAALRAASQGRVHRLCIRDATNWMGPLDAALDRVGLSEEDLANATVVETLRTDGQGFVVKQDRLPADEPVVAELRY